MKIPNALKHHAPIILCILIGYSLFECFTLCQLSHMPHPLWYTLMLAIAYYTLWLLKRNYHRHKSTPNQLWWIRVGIISLSLTPYLLFLTTLPVQVPSKAFVIDSGAVQPFVLLIFIEKMIDIWIDISKKKPLKGPGNKP
ncbi:hypothetical protein F5984_23675 [Rudanella paleaurantiibacter]|uniref:Uncharacterized protein n=1 Tax=Rudanella paleaurantiibacter TaxID=2614655 RepID=A0A7J5TSQ5_9BACT|nr:hypothetical protein [Rudanella paleaurantiibacter]KAB7726630.1 hypothetical protein F5984_23675 [Rudanella paleaurantiibacter]